MLYLPPLPVFLILQKGAGKQSFTVFVSRVINLKFFSLILSHIWLVSIRLKRYICIYQSAYFFVSLLFSLFLSFKTFFHRYRMFSGSLEWKPYAGLLLRLLMIRYFILEKKRTGSPLRKISYLSKIYHVYILYK